MPRCVCVKSPSWSTLYNLPNYLRGRGILLAECGVATWRYPWQRGGHHGYNQLHRQDFASRRPPDPGICSPVSPRHPCPAGRTSRVPRADMHRSRMVDHADRGPGGHVQRAPLRGYSPDDLPLLARVMGAPGAVTADVRKPMAGALKKHRRPAWNSSRICGAKLSSSVPRVRSSVAIQ